MYFSSLWILFGLWSAIDFSKAKSIYVYNILGDLLIEVKTIENPSLGQPEIGHGSLIEVAG